MVSATAGDGGSATGDHRAAPQKRNPRVRRGLGKGLGALIPDAETSPTPRTQRPLDVLFPDLAGAEGNNSGADGQNRNTIPRGGSARDLLSPRGASTVSRETSMRREARSQTRSAEESESGAPTAVLDAEIAVVPRETLLLGEAIPPSSDKAGSLTLGGTEEQEHNSNNVSRETTGASDQEPAHPSGASVLSKQPQVSNNWEAELGGAPQLSSVPGVSFAEIPPNWIIPNTQQPREIFEEEDLQTLAESIKEVGVLQPVVVRRINEESLREGGEANRLREALAAAPEARYELVMGERRWRAAQLAGLQALPAIVRSTANHDLLREALIENIHRVQLNPLEEGAAYAQLMDDFGYTQEEVALKVAKSRPQVANMLRLLKLPPGAQRMLAAGVITAGHARALLGMGSAAEMEALATRIVAEGLSVRATEELVKYGKHGAAPRRPTRLQHVPTPEAQRIADIFAARLDTSVTVSTGAKKGKLTIEFADQADLDRIFAVLGLAEATQ